MYTKKKKKKELTTSISCKNISCSPCSLAAGAQAGSSTLGCWLGSGLSPLSSYNGTQTEGYGEQVGRK